MQELYDVILTPEAVSGLVGLFVPVIVDFVNVKLGAQKQQYKYIIALAISGIVGLLVTAADAGGFKELYANADTLVVSAGAAFAASQTVYNTYWKPSGNSDKLKQTLK